MVKVRKKIRVTVRVTVRVMVRVKPRVSPAIPSSTPTRPNSEPEEPSPSIVWKAASSTESKNSSHKMHTAARDRVRVLRGSRRPARAQPRAQP